jgi:malonyl-CoA/methylmalonyl-CoA synthetase
MSETLMLVSNPYFEADGPRIAGTVGVPLPGVDVRVVGDDGMPCAGARWWRPGEKAQRIRWLLADARKRRRSSPGWMVQDGDVGALAVYPRRYLTLVGRSKDLIISGGYNVYPKEIEGYIDEMPGVVESAVIGLPHPDFGEAVAAVVVGKGSAVDATRIVDALKSRIANYKVPKRVFIVDDLPRNTMGKVQKNVLRDRYRNTFTPLPVRTPA